MTKTPAQVRKEWVKVLRSGKLRQGQSALATKNNNKHYSYCCLGVLCELAVKEGLIKKESPEHVGYYRTYTHEDRFDKYYLPPVVREWAGLRSNQGSFQNTSLANLNDQGENFKKIADVIEQEPNGLVV